MDAIAAPTDVMGWIVTALAVLTILAGAGVLVCLLGAAGEYVSRRRRTDRPMPAVRAIEPVTLFDVEATEPDPLHDDADDESLVADSATAPRHNVPSFVRPGDSSPDDVAVVDAPVLVPSHAPAPLPVSGPQPEPVAAGELRLPAGAEAALNAIAELFPDPRNVVVTHRDPTGEVLIRRAEDLTELRRGA
jgi:hypothetical protein